MGRVGKKPMIKPFIRSVLEFDLLDPNPTE
ncbi:hypothetical protein COLO4_28835 [Corchorus olitorius]|uniref:Uncharacterized protein n=1 Tax=Corchorus olitorius TaxID=93759 RepID=A0A1R3HI36_9ROSI|nr:hypothetical protein COLO4_28835 [Corchorus olitorius]